MIGRLRLWAARRARGHGVRYRGHNLPAEAGAGRHRTLWVELENTGTRAWRGGASTRGRTDLAVLVDGAVVTGGPLPRPTVRPGERVTFAVEWMAPARPGRYRLAVDLVEQEVAYYSQRGFARPEVELVVTAEDARPGEQLATHADARGEWFFRPAQRVTRGRDGFHYPGFAAATEGCRLTDVDGRVFVDYVMGWGSAWLGYAHPAVREAIRAAAASGATPSLTGRTQLAVADALCGLVPGAERVLFGKNGSDVCTAAVRLARAATRRPLVVVSGYHGWQDWYLQSGGFADAAAVPPVRGAVVHARFNDAAHLASLLSKHRGRVAAVMMEAAAAIAGLNGPVHEADPSYLADARALCRREGALLILDEVFTGLRYPGGSVQAAFGVDADLTCLGKAIGGGMPLSALVGTTAAFAALPRIYYGPTYQGETCSLAAAEAAVAAARSCDAVGHVRAFAERLRRGVDERCRAHGVPAALVGPPVRMVLSFREPDAERVVQMRTLVQQELLRAGVITYRGFLLPSLAHDEDALRQTLSGFDRALGAVARARSEDAFARYLDMPAVI
ncbi:MAG: aminotransferase class III-fold pyridoxal phosphate-dependent enzyme [Vicinamibacteria bacterium]